MYRHTHSTSTPSTVKSLDTLGRQRGREEALEDVILLFFSQNIFLTFQNWSQTRLYRKGPNICCSLNNREILSSPVKNIQVEGGWGHLRNRSRSAVSWLLWICCCTTVSGPNRRQLRQNTKTPTSKKWFIDVNHRYACVGVCVSMPYLQVTAVVVSACCVLQLLCVQAPWWPSQDKHKLLSTVSE